MPDYYVAINRNKITAASAAEAANIAVTTPLGPNDTQYVKELDPKGSFYTIPGMRVTGVIGTAPTPDLQITGNMVLPPPPPMPAPEIPPP